MSLLERSSSSMAMIPRRGAQSLPSRVFMHGQIAQRDLLDLSRRAGGFGFPSGWDETDAR